jgi:hypothetical protein
MEEGVALCVLVIEEREERGAEPKGRDAELS